MRIISVIVVVFGINVCQLPIANAQTIKANVTQCPKGFQPYADRCVSQRMADYISCVESSGGNRQAITEEISNLIDDTNKKNFKVEGGNRVANVSAGIALDKKAEAALVHKIESRWFSGGMSECGKVMTSSITTKRMDSKIDLVDYSVSYPKDESVTFPEIDIKMRNIGDQVAFLKEIRLNVLGQATYEDCRKPAYSLVKESATYDIDIDDKPIKSISHDIKPKDVERIIVKVGRKMGGPTLSVYKAQLLITYDGDNKKVSGKPFFLKLVGPTVPLALTYMGTTEDEWNACVTRNKAAFSKIGYKIYEDD